MKDPTTNSKPTIYFAGKISEFDWRSELFGDDRFGCIPDGDLELWNPDYRLDMGPFWYGGPFFIYCEHCCTHGSGKHGSGEAYVPTDAGLQLRQDEVWKVNRERVERADMLFVYIDAATCYGTLIEIGYALARGKTIHVGMSEQLTRAEERDLWMVAAATGRDVTWGSPQAAWRRFSALHLPRKRSLIRT